MLTSWDWGGDSASRRSFPNTRRPPCPTTTSPTPAGALTTPAGSPKTLIHTRKGRIAGIYCDQPTKILQVETQDRIERATDPGYRAFCSVICPKTSLKVLDGYGTSVAHMLTMAFDDPTVDGDLRTALTAHEIVLDQEWADVE